MFAARLEHDPRSPFVLTPDGTERTYAAVAAVADDLAVQLAESGVGRGDTVGLYLWNDPRWVVAMFACWWLGAIPAACGGQTPTAEAARRFALAGAKVVVAADTVAPPEGWPTIKVSVEGESPDARSRRLGARVVPDPDDPAAVFFTSGTTGQSKAILYRHRKLGAGPRLTAGAYARSADFRPRTLPDAPPALGFNPFGHAAGVGRMLFRMYVGRPILLVSKFDVRVVQALAARYRLDTLQLTPAMVYSLAFTDEDLDLGSLRYVSSGTAPLPMSTREAFEARYGVPVLQAYGSTEGGVTALERYEDVVAGRRGPGSVGRVSESTPMRIVDGDGREVAPGEDGEILGRPDRDRGIAYISDRGPAPLPTDDEGWYHTGDVGHVDEHGILHITGRIKEMMIVGGFNVYPSEVEHALRASELVRDVVVVPLPDERMGSVPAAGIVWGQVADGLSPERRQERLVDECRTTLERYKIPRSWFTLEEVPLSPNGKVDRGRALELALRSGADGAAPG
jgi:acyl-CoA synthetase (AMP-forming)/AMP-acid ligase II